MQAQALICNADREFELADVTLAEPAPTNLSVRAMCSGVSIGTEFAVIMGKINWGTYPLTTGYQAVGVVERVGDDVAGFAVGDRVYYRDNASITLPDGVSVTAAAGTHCSAAVIDPASTHGIARVPEGVDDEPACLYVMPAVGLNGVDMANPRMGDVVVVHGVGLIGLGVVAACSHRGCTVIAIDIEDARLDVARKLGADHAINGAHQDAAAAVHEIAQDGADVVFECTGIPACLDPAIAMCRTHGKFVHQGHYGQAPISYNYSVPHGKRLTTFYPCDDGLANCRTAVLKNMAMGALAWGEVITHRVQAADAPDLYASIRDGASDGVLGAVIHWS
ncbi:hypothetical protein CMK11_16975 [Candidatus Poribacteria bacterium]|nr:hypothetical protein [Candidatus Poribacteria bacterium]